MMNNNIMKLIVGLGNPGEKYKHTRHNVGFMVLDKIQTLDNDNIRSFGVDHKFQSQVTQFGKDGEKMILVKPETYMNLSGEAVKKIKEYYKVENKDIIVICDDLNLDLGKVRVRFGGSDGGHNGLKSIIDNMGNDFWRIRVGIGSNKDITASDGQTISMNAEDYVLGKFDESERGKINDAVDKIAQHVLESISYGLKEETF